VTVSEDLASRLAQGRHLTEGEIASLAASHDIITIGMMAGEVRGRLHGARTTFLRVADVPAALGGAMSWPAAAGEVRIVGTPLSRKAAVERVREVAALAKGTPVSGFSLADLERLAAGERVTLRALLEELQAAGLELVANAAFDLLQDPKRSIEEVNISGLALARLTIQQLASSDMPGLFKRVAELQSRVAVIRAFAPLPRAFNAAVPTTGYDDVKRVALARLIVDNIASIQVDWSLYGPKLAQVALTVGADDVDAVSPEDETGEGRRRTPLEEIRRNIRAASQTPVERNGRFEMLDDPADAGAAGSGNKTTERVNAKG
jgi:aminodeoxyfutalosine synthase